MNKKRVLSIILAMAVVVNLFITNPVNRKKVLAEDPEPGTLNVTKTIDWNPNSPTNAKITITSDVPDVNNTEVLFLGTLCSKHGMGGLNDPTGNVIVKSINAIANNANVDYWLLDADIDGTGNADHKSTDYKYNLDDTNYEHQGRVLRGETMNVTTSKGVRIVDGSNHTAIYGFAKLLIQELENKSKEYDYIVLEFDATRIARFSRLMFPENYDVFTNVFDPLAELLAPYYEDNKVIWITDGFDPDYTPGPSETFDDKYGRQPYTPTNFYYYNGDRNFATLSASEFKALCALVAPTYYLQYKDVDTTSDSYPETGGYFGPKNQAEYDFQQPKNKEFTLGSDYSLKPGTLVTDLIYGEPEEYKAYSADSRQLYYNNASELSKFLYMAIQGTTLKFDDKIHMADDITIENVKVSVSKKEEPTSDSDWIQKDYLDASTATPTTDLTTGQTYIANSQTSDVADEIKVFVNNNNPEIDNQIELTVKDLKNQLKFVKVEINVTDEKGFKSCIKLKNDGKTPPTILNKDGNPWQPGDEYVYEMNPNDGLANVDAYKNGNTTGSGDAHGDSPAKAPALDIYHVTSTVEGGVQDFDESKQDGRILSSDTAKSEIVVSTYEKDSPYLTYKPNAGYEFESVTIDENTVIGPSDFDQEGKASGTITKGKYEITFDSETGAVKVAIPGIVADRVVKVKYAAPKIEITKTVVSPTSGVVAKAGDVVEFKITVKNTGTVIAKDFTISDTIDTEKVTYKESDNSGSYNTTTHTVSWDIESLAAGASKDLSLKVTVLSDLEGEKNLINVAGGQFNRTTPTPIPNCTPAEQPLKGRDVSVVYHVSGDIPSSYTTPSSLTKTYGTTLTNDEITAMTVPTIDGYEFTEWKLNEDFSGSSFDTSKNLNDTNFTSLQNGGSQIDLYGKWKIIKDFGIEKSVTLADGTAITGDVAPGTTVLYSIKVTNKNQYVDIKDVVVSDTVPTGLTISDASDTPSIDGQKITWTVDIGKGSSKTLTFKATVPSDLKVRTKYDNVATINSADGDSINKNSNTSTFYAGPENITLTVEKAWSDTWNSHASETLKVRLYRKLKTESDDKYTAVTDVNIIELTSSNPSKTVSVPQYDEDGNEYDYIFREITVNASAGTETKYEAGDMYGDYEVSYDTTTARKTKISNDYIVKVTDLEIDKTVSATIAAPGDTITYTITVKNTRKYESATGIKVTDVLPTGVTIASTNGLNADIGTASNSGNNVTWEISSLAGDTTATLTIKVVVGSNLNATQLLNVASIVEFDGTTYDDDDYPSPKVKTDVRTFKVTKAWSNPSATHSAVTVKLLQNGNAYTTNGQVSLDSSNSWTYTWTNLPMYDKDEKLYVYTVDEVAVDGYETEITYTDKDLGYTSALVTNTLKTYDVKYNIVSQENPGVAVPDTETLDWGTAYDAEDPLKADGYVFSGWYTDADCKVPYVDGMVLNDTNVPSGTFNLYGSWKSVKDFAITKAVSYQGASISEPVAPGSTVLYTITVKNKNANAPIKNVVISDVVPDGLTISNVSDSGKVTGQTIEWTLDMTKDETKTLTFNATVPADLKVEKKYDNVATVVSADGEPVGVKSPTSTFKAKPADIVLSVAKDWSDKWTSHDTETVYVQLSRKIASETSYTPVEVVELTAAEPAKSLKVPPYDKDGNLYEYIFRELTAQSGTELADGEMNGKYKVSYDTTTTAGTTNILNTYIIDANDFEFNKTTDSDLSEPGEVFNYTITVKNTRDYETATNVVVTDTLPEGVTLVTPDGLVFTSPDTAVDDGKGNITWTIPTLAPGTTATLVIKVTVDDGVDASRLTNIAQIKEVGDTSYDPTDFPSPPALTDVRTFTAKKIWSNPTAEHDAVTVVLLQNGQPYAVNPSVELSSTNGWTYTWTKLPMYDASNNYYVYTVEEIAVPGYSTITSYSGGTYGNTSVDIENTLKTYDISYQIVGSVIPSGVTVPSGDTVDWGTMYTAKDKLSKEYYVFSGWFEDSSCTTPYVDGTVINDTTAPGGKKVLYGKWERLTTDITFQPGNGKHPDSDQVVYPKDTTEYRGEFYPMPNDAVYGGEDYKFGGWFLDPECTKPYVPGTLTMEKLPLYAKWTYLPTVSYKFTGDVPADAKLPATERMPEGTAYNADSKTKSTDYYTFDGWYTDSACTKKYVDGTKIYENTVLYGKWTRKTSNVILVPGAGDGPNPGDVTYPTIPTGKRGDILPTPPDPTYNGSDYKFGGWFLDPDCTMPYVPGPMTKPEIKLYAKWTTLPVVKYAFVGETPDGVKLPGMDVVQPGTAYRTTSPSGTTALYVFDGWYLDIACTQKYVEGTRIYEDTLVYGRWLPVFPKTGEDRSSHTSWAVVLLLSGAGIATFLCIDKKRRSHN